MYLAIKLVLCVFALCDLIVFMVYWAIAYSEPCETSKMELFVKLVTSKEVTFLFRRLKGFWKCLCRVQCKLLCQFLVYIAVYFRSEITCTFCHFRTIRFPFKKLSIGFLVRLNDSPVVEL